MYINFHSIIFIYTRPFKQGQPCKPGTHKLAWILADVIMAPTLTSSGCLARVGMLGPLPLLTAKLIQAKSIYCSNKANTIIESWNVLWFSTVQNRIEKAPPLLNFYISIIQAAKHNYSKTTQNMVLNCKWQIHLHIENGKYIIHFNTKNYHNILYM